ncbi:MAG: chromosomal replication initiator protein DnaA [Planctomycetes bacterium]|nr:chromosomal replication initiator protein DnaA [Planctomycetota bacterium]
MSELAPSWEKLLLAVRSSHPDLYRSWFEGLASGQLVNGELRVVVADPVQYEYLETQCASAFTRAAMELTGRLLPVRFVPPAALLDGSLVAHSRPPFPSSPLNPDYTFDQFVVGPSNRLAHAACQAVCAQPGVPYNPLFIHGGSGLGKSHLLHAIGASLRSSDVAPNVIYVSCETFVNEFIRAIETGTLAAFRDGIRCADALLIDDVQFLANRESSQEELFHTFNVLHQSRRQIVLSADASPVEIPTLEDRLVSRFTWGLVATVGRPDRETRHAILQKKARLRGVEIPDEVLDFIAEQVSSNIRVLEGALTKLVTEANIGNKPLTVDTAREVLGAYPGPAVRALQVSDILDAVSRHYGVRLPDLIGRRRSRSLSHPRQVGMYLARKLTPLSLQEIGGYFGGRDHSTVLHAERWAVDRRRHDREQLSRFSFRK